MKKFIFLLGFLCIVVGCGKQSEEDVVNNFIKNVQNSNGYHITGNLEIYRNEELYTYTVDSSFTSQDKFRVSLINQTNNHEQIILKNEDGVYVITRKSTKFNLQYL